MKYSSSVLETLGKSLEIFGRKLRPYFAKSYRLAYRQMLARGLKEWQPGEPIVCFDLANQAIDAVGARYNFSLIRDVIDAGYFPVFVAHRGTLSSFGTSGIKSLLLTERLGVIKSLRELKEPFRLITDRNAAAPANATQVVKVSYEHRLCSSPTDVAFPVFVHPKLTVRATVPLEYDTRAARSARLFFGGNTDGKTYDKDVLRDFYQMLTRREMLAVASEAIGPENIHRPKDCTIWLPSTDFHPFVLCEKPFKIPQEFWLEAMGKADFFLACPGVGMPLCHNLIESMAAGTVPILQYARYITPELIDGVNCLGFHDEASLHQVLKRILEMSQEEIVTLRANVRAYYEQYLATGRFAKRLLGSPHPRQTLLLNAYRVPRRPI